MNCDQPLSMRGSFCKGEIWTEIFTLNLTEKTFEKNVCIPLVSIQLLNIGSQGLSAWPLCY